MGSLAFMPKGKFLRQGYITTAFYAIEFGVKSPCKESWPPLQKLLIHKGKILRKRAKLLGLPLMCLIDRVYSIVHDWGGIQLEEPVCLKLSPCVGYIKGRFYTI